MLGKELHSPAALAILALAEIKAATRAFDDGQANVFDALDAIVVAIAAYQSVAASRRDAA